MKYTALLRGINVGGNRKVEMKRLKALFEAWGFESVSTYLNSGNVIFESNKKQNSVKKVVEEGLKREFGFDIPSLVKNEQEVEKIANAIPATWKNDDKQKSDLAYLFPEIDSKDVLAELPVRKEYIDVRYIKGAIFWNLDRKNYNKSRLNKLIGHRLYQLMTVRNVNTARRLVGK